MRPAYKYKTKVTPMSDNLASTLIRTLSTPLYPRLPHVLLTHTPYSTFMILLAFKSDYHLQE